VRLRCAAMSPASRGGKRSPRPTTACTLQERASEGQRSGAMRGGGDVGAGAVRLCYAVPQRMDKPVRLAQRLRRNAQMRLEKLETSAAMAVRSVASTVGIVDPFATHEITHLVMCRKVEFASSAESASSAAQALARAEACAAECLQFTRRSHGHNRPPPTTEPTPRRHG
jgi:hypothetical protein